MDRRKLMLSVATGLFLAPGLAGAASAPRRPNFIVILCDDLGYGDTSLNPGGLIKTPHLEQMAAEGMVLSDYYAPANLCTPSRAGLLTGRYAIRSGLGYEVIMQKDDRGLPASEVTIAAALKPHYVSGLFGKWHLGHAPEHWPPTKHGFDRFFGIPYSHDMAPLWLSDVKAGGEEVRQDKVELSTLQQQFYAQAEAFIEENAHRPFFVELALSAPHLPEHPLAGADVSGRTGPYGVVVQEIDALMGRLMDRLKALGIDQNTLVIFTSDNGPWFEGSSGGLRDRKGGAAYDGGFRVPFVARWPGTIPAGRRTTAIAMGIDILPTLCALAGQPLPVGVEIDGKDLSGVLRTGAGSPHDQLILFDNETPVGIRTQRWKYVASTYYRGMRAPIDGWGHAELYDLQADPSESYSVAASHPDVLADMKARLVKARADFAGLKHKDIPPFFKAMRGVMEHMQD
jgi:uncharacterized sulfatase